MLTALSRDCDITALNRDYDRGVLQSLLRTVSIRENIPNCILHRMMLPSPEDAAKAYTFLKVNDEMQIGNSLFDEAAGCLLRV